MDLQYTPCPAKDFRLPRHSVHDLSAWASSYFHHVTALYPRLIRKDVQAMYDKNEHLIDTTLLTRTKGTFALTEREWNGETFCIVTLDKIVDENPLLNAWSRLHEIGGHVGQILCDSKDNAAFKGVDFNSHMEMTAALCEYHFIYPLDQKIIDTHVAGIENPVVPDGRLNVRGGVLKDIQFIQTHEMLEYLSYRNEYYKYPAQAIETFKRNSLELLRLRDAHKPKGLVPFFKNLFS